MDTLSFVGNGKVSVRVVDIVNSPKVQRQVQAARELMSRTFADNQNSEAPSHPTLGEG
jgi:hypothetical protein